MVVTVVPKHGMTEIGDLWAWRSLFTDADGERDGVYKKSNSRCNVLVSIARPNCQVMLAWQLATPCR
jgi:hypothetical protein